ncbi:MAG: VapC toxin family PIN domain ribonuclease [Candidatus Parabeggiatoa sp. nov. 3]|nr:MAG: VapC toxin family PIN domain ribonuclease [Gammaproteobacteria bacterium]HEW98919.1 PIN domain-containing protein [Beggiatoa sp.]
MLIDTNVFLEILLEQEQRALCKQFITDNLDEICISDFSLHSIAVVTFRKNKANLFTQFTQDMLFHLDVLTLPKSDYAKMNTVAQSLNLDFDDAYQYSIAKCYDLKLVTLDKDFKDLNLNDVEVVFLPQA